MRVSLVEVAAGAATFTVFGRPALVALAVVSLLVRLGDARP